MARTEITEVSDERGRPNELNLLQKVRTFWIKGVLEKSLYQEAQLALGLEVRPTAVVRLSETLIQTSEQSTPQPLPPASTIQQVYDEANGQLLILGAPGTGKTTMLLDLTQDLLTRAMRDENHLLPVVFNLSSWAEKRPTLTAWLVDELRLRYDVPRAIAQEWVGKGRILPLLDGLDEVRAEERGACVEAINKYREAHGLDPLVVCSRIAEYEALAARLILTTAVLIQPLSREQVEHYLAELGSPAEGLRQMLAADAELRKLAETPVMLNVLLLTYEGGPAETIAEPPPDGSAPSTRVFAAYVERMFERRGADRRYSREQTLHWLAWLARGMTQQGQTLFFLERLQPDWLPTRPLLRRYVLVDRLGSGLVAGVTVGWSSG
ncbi:MAG: NACHT domain-containing protein [Anaerolineae bacterium]